MPTGTRRRARNPANALTLARVPLALLFLLCYPAGAIALAVELTDLLDGALACRLDCVTDLGKRIPRPSLAWSRPTVRPKRDAYAR